MTKTLSDNPHWSFNDCKRHVITTIASIKIDQWSVLAGLITQLDNFAPEQAVSIQKYNPNVV